MTGEQSALPPAGWPAHPAAGVILHPTSLPSNGGIGDIGDSALEFVGHLAAMNLGAWQILPTGPTAFGDSPYQPLSAFAGNELLIGVDVLVREGLLLEDEVRRLGKLPDSRVDFGAVIRIKSDLLQTAAGRFDAVAGTADRAAFDDFLHRNDEAWLHGYATFRALKTIHGDRPWTAWDPGYRDRGNPKVKAFEGANPDAIERIKRIQFFFDRQWTRLRACALDRGVRIFGDMPYYIAPDSADAWARPELLELDSAGRPTRVAGVPPDYFSEDGQRWGNPVYDWPVHERENFAWWIERFRHAADRFDLVRVDHFRGFESFWAVPAGSDTARDGSWNPAPGDALFSAVRGALGDLPVLAEDLGVITDEVGALRRRHGVPGMKVLQFELADPDFDPAKVPVDCLCTTATHDNDTTRGWFNRRGATRRAREESKAARRNALRLTGGSARTIHHDLVRLAFGTPARVAMAPLQDFLGLGSRARMNTPGTGRRNWRWRFRQGQLNEAVEEKIAGLVEQSGRARGRFSSRPQGRSYSRW